MRCATRVVAPHAVRVCRYSSIAGRDNNLPTMLAAYGLIEARLTNRKRSKGAADEIEYFQAAGDPIVYLDI